MQYKCIPIPNEISFDKEGGHDKAARCFADIINREANGGWAFHSMQNIAIKQEPGCLAAFLGNKGTIEYINVLVFSYEKPNSTSNKVVDKNILSEE